MKNDNSSLFAVEFEALLGELSSEETITKLEEEINRLKSEIDVNLLSRNISPDVLSRIYSNLCKEKGNLAKLEENLKLLFNAKEVEEIQNLQDNSKEKKTKIKQIFLFDQYFNQIFELVQFLQKVKIHFDLRQYWKANDCIEKANEKLAVIVKGKDHLFPPSISQPSLVNDFDCVSEKLKGDINIVYEKFIYDLIQVFKENILIENVPGRDFKVFRCSLLSVMTELECESFLKCIVHHQAQFAIYFKNLFDQLCEHLVKHILLDNTSAVLTNHKFIECRNYDLSFDRITLACVTSEMDTEQTRIDMVKRLIEDVISLFTFNRSISIHSELIKFMGLCWSDQLFSCLIKYYFETLMPRVESQFEPFADVLKEGFRLESFMKSIGLIEQDNSVLKEYTRNIKEHFSTKLSQDFIIRTKRFLKLDMNELISSEVALANLKLNCKNKLPTLKVSRFMVDIKNILEEMSALFTSSSSNLKFLLVETFENVCELFVDISPFLFKVNIERSARQNALFHNNFVFFGFLVECLLLTHPTLHNSLSEFIPTVRNMASQIFLYQMGHQEKLLLSFIQNEIFTNSLNLIINEIPSTDLKISSKSHFEFRQCINNCLKHLSMLHSSLVDILPQKLSEKTFTTLITSFLNQFIVSIIALDDIRSLGASHLSHELDYFSKELKQFLSNSENLVSKWMKMNEVNFILKSSLLEIVNRWADGKGLLANYLTDGEVKHLIRALFQNNERRSNALAKIK